MRLHTQPPGSNTCGHCVVAMLAGCHPREVEDSLRHNRGTSWRELHSLLFIHGVICEPELVIAHGIEDLPERAVICLPGNPGHWVAYAGGMVYCPSLGQYEPEDIIFPPSCAARKVKYAKVATP